MRGFRVAEVTRRVDRTQWQTDTDLPDADVDNAEAFTARLERLLDRPAVAPAPDGKPIRRKRRR
jgi:hypothetical protein